jgi:hypothetical protein
VAREKKQPPGNARPLRVVDPPVEQRAEPSHPGRLRHGGQHDGLGEDRPRGADRGQLQRLLRPEVREQAALADRQLLGEPADRDAVQPLDRREVDGAPQHRAPGLVPAPDPAVGGWLARSMHGAPRKMACVGADNK